MTFRHSPTAFVTFSLAGLLACAASPTLADTRTEAIVGGILIHTVRTTWAGLSPEQRADKVQERLNVALGQGPIHPRDITVGQRQGDWCVLFRGRRFLTADPLTAHQDRTPPKALAARWADRLRHVLPDLTRNKGK